MSNLVKLTAIASLLGSVALVYAEPGHAALPPAVAQILLAKQEFDGQWAVKTTVSPAPVVPGAQDLPAEPLDLDGDTMLGTMFLIYENRKNGGGLMGSYQNVRERSEEGDDDEEDLDKPGTVSGVVRNRRVADSETGENTPDESQREDAGDPAAAAAAELKKLERDVFIVVIVDIPDEDEDIVLRYRGTQLRTEMKGTVELGKRNKDGKFEKGGDGTFIARKLT